MQPPLMEFSIFGFLVIKNLRSDLFTFELDMNVTVEGFDRDFDSCQVGLYLVPITGIESFKAVCSIERCAYIR
jgi:hypothetical protein